MDVGRHFYNSFLDTIGSSKLITRSKLRKKELILYIMSQKSNRPQHDRSRRIKDFENNNIINLIEREDGVTLATAAVQLWLSQKPNHTSWTKHHTGVICFVKDYTKKSYFFRLYSLVPHQLWEQEMYTPFSYNQLTKNFHYFASDDCNAGFNFAFEDEAEKFYNIVMNKIMSKTRRNNTRAVNGSEPNGQLRTNGQHNQQNNPNMNSTSHLSNSANSVNSSMNYSSNSNNSKTNTPMSSLTNKFSTLKKNKKFDKTQIGAPTNFRIVQHVGLTNNDYEINVTAKDESVKMRDILSAISIQGVPMNKKTENFINNYIRNNGGMERFDEELKKQKAPAPPPVLPTTPANTNHYPKPVPQHQQQQNNSLQHTRPAPTPNMNRTSHAPSVPPPPPPPPPPPMPQQQQQQQQQQHQSQHYTPAQLVFTPTQTPPPPPPPLPAMNKPNGSYPTPKMEPVINSMNSVNITPSTGSAPPPPPPPPPPSIFQTSSSTPVIQKSTPKQPIEPPKPNPRDELLNSIKNFQGLKPAGPVSESNTPEVPAAASTSEPSVLEQLKIELQMRAKFFNDSDEDDDENSDSEWQ